MGANFWHFLTATMGIFSPQNMQLVQIWGMVDPKVTVGGIWSKQKICKVLQF